MLEEFIDFVQEYVVVEEKALETFSVLFNGNRIDTDDLKTTEVIDRKYICVACGYSTDSQNDIIDHVRDHYLLRSRSEWTTVRK